MPKTFHVALREFNSTVLTKGFILGVVMTPVLVLLVIGAMALVTALQGPKITGTVAIIDHSGSAAAHVIERFGENGAKADAERTERVIGEEMSRNANRIQMSGDQQNAIKGFSRSAASRAAESMSGIDLEVLPPDTDIEAQKQALRDANLRGPKRAEGDAKPRIAVAVISPEVVRPVAPPEGETAPPPGGSFELFVAPKLDFEIQRGIERKIRGGIVDARIAADPRVQQGGLDPKSIRALVTEPRVSAVAVTKEGEKQTSELAGIVIPAGFMLLLLVAVMTAGQYLLTTTIEEKGSRVMEVLLSAVSPMQLMVGKIVGQMGVGLLILIVYSGLGIASLMVFSMQYLLNPMNLVYLVIFFLIAFFLIASMMAAIGSAVTELREAQTLMTPIMAVIMTPWILWLPISRAPNSTFANVMSFVPGVNPFVMMIRLAGSEPIPAWQIPASIAVGVLSAVIAAWAAAKIFRVGILMYGKPPNFRTLWRWVRMA